MINRSKNADLICIPRPASGQSLAEPGCFRADAESLAIAYHAYHGAVAESDWLQAEYWGRRLLEACDATGADLRGHVAELMPHYEAMADERWQATNHRSRDYERRSRERQPATYGAVLIEPNESGGKTGELLTEGATRDDLAQVVSQLDLKPGQRVEITRDQDWDR